jgi:hypothetical protein
MRAYTRSRRKQIIDWIAEKYVAMILDMGVVGVEKVAEGEGHYSVLREGELVGSWGATNAQQLGGGNGKRVEWISCMDANCCHV